MNSWNTIVNISGAGNSNTIINYSYTDETEDTQLYYKLQQTDYDGSNSFSQVIQVICEENVFELQYVVSENDNLIVAFNSKEEDTYQIKLYDILGRMVLETNMLSSHKGLNVIQYNSIDLVKGVYILSYESQKRKLTEKILLK